MFWKKQYDPQSRGNWKSIVIRIHLSWSTLRTKPPRWSLKSKETSMVFSFVTESILLHDLISKPSIDIQTCQVVNYSSNVADSSCCLWTNWNFPLLVRREIRTRRLQLRAQSLSFRLSPSLFSCFSPCSSLAALCALGSHALATI